MKPTLFRRLLQIGAFMHKEAIDVLHQPRLLLTLVIGPFAIMAVFGIGYKDSPDALRTLFVAPAGSPLLEKVETYADDIGNYVKYAGVSNDPADAQRQLLEGKVDLLVSFPDKPIETILAGKQPPIIVTHTRLDPIERTAIRFASQIAVDKINGQILAAVLDRGKAFADPAIDVLASTDDALTKLDSAVGGGDPAALSTAIAEVQAATADLATAGRIDSAITARLADSGADGEAAVGEAEKAIVELQGSVQALNAQATPEKIARVRQSLDTIRTDYSRLAQVDPGILVRPFGREVQLAVENVTNVTDWYAPAAIVLMLQQFGVAFGALSFVRERELGIVEVFRVAPVNATETLLGKYLAYMLIGGGIGAVLTAAVVLALGVPLAAGIGDVAIAMGLSLFAAIGLGFVISLASGSDAQAVQYTLILLLASLFFSGFFLSIGQMEGVAKWAGFLLPVTYGMQLLRDVMLRGDSLDMTITLQLLAYGVVMFILALLGTRRRLAVAR